MNTGAGIAEPPPSTTAPSAPPAQSARPSMAEAAAAQKAVDQGGKPPAPPAQKPADKPAAAAKAPAATEPAAKRSPALAAIKPPSSEKAPTAPAAKPGDAPAAKPAAADDEMKQQSRWLQLKAAETELLELKPKFEATQKEKADWVKERADVAKKLERLEELQREKDFTDFTQTETYKKDVDTPFQAIQTNVENVATYAGVKLDDLMKAMREPNPLLREEKITAVLEEAKKPVKAGNIATLVQDGGKLNELATKHAEFEKNATLQKQQHDNAQKAQNLQAETEGKEIMKRAYTEISNATLKPHKDVFDDGFKAAFAKTFGVESADPFTDMLEWAQQEQSQDPMDKGFRHIAQFLPAVFMEQIRGLKAELAELKGEKVAENDAKPGIKPDTSKDTTVAPKYGSLKEATLAHKEAGARF